MATTSHGNVAKDNARHKHGIYADWSEENYPKPLDQNLHTSPTPPISHSPQPHSLPNCPTESKKHAPAPAQEFSPINPEPSHYSSWNENKSSVDFHKTKKQIGASLSNLPNVVYPRISNSSSQEFSNEEKTSQRDSPRLGSQNKRTFKVVRRNSRIENSKADRSKEDKEVSAAELFRQTSSTIMYINDDLREKLSDLEKENAILKRRVKRLRGYIPKNKELEDELEEVKKNNAELKIELEAARSWLDEAGLKLVDELKKANEEIFQLNTENKMHVIWQKTEAGKLNTNIATLKNRLTSSQEERKKLESHISRLQETIKHQQMDLGISAINENNEKTKMVKSKITSKFSGVIGEKTKLQNLIKSMRTESQQYSADKLSAKEDKSNGKKSNGRSKSMSSTDTERRRLADIIKRLKSAGTDSENEANTSSEALLKRRSSRYSRNRNSQPDFERYQTQLKDASLEKANLMSMVQTLRNEIKDSTIQRKDAEQRAKQAPNPGKVKKIKSKLKSTMKEKIELQRKLRALTKERKEMEEETKNKDKKIAQLETGAKFKSKIRGMEATLQSHLQVEKELRDQLSKNVGQIKNLESTLYSTQSGKLELQVELQQTANETKKLEKEKKSLTASSGLLVNHLIENITKNKSLENKLREAENKGENMKQQLNGAAARVELLEQELKREHMRKLESMKRAAKSESIVLINQPPTSTSMQEYLNRHPVRIQTTLHRQPNERQQRTYSTINSRNTRLAASPLPVSNRVSVRQIGGYEAEHMIQPGKVSYLSLSAQQPYQEVRERNAQMVPAPVVTYQVARPKKIIQYTSNNYI